VAETVRPVTQRIRGAFRRPPDPEQALREAFTGAPPPPRARLPLGEAITEESLTGVPRPFLPPRAVPPTGALPPTAPPVAPRKRHGTLCLTDRGKERKK